MFEHPLISLAQLTVSPERASGALDDFQRDVLLIESNDWVNVVALDESGETAQLVLIRQWRFGCGAQTLEIPGGLIDPGEQPAEAARRELLEETGYACGRIEPIGVVQPNPALFNNRCHLFLARDLKHTGTPIGDGDEEIEVLLKPLSDTPRLLREGEIQHALVITALHFFGLWRESAAAEDGPLS